MSRIPATFERLKRDGEKALVAYVTAGDPTIERSFEVVSAVLNGGADVLELGVPFSDPTADGVVIQRAAVRALSAGMTVAGVLHLVERIRAAGHQQPIVLFGYYNPFLQYGLKELAADAAKAGADGFLVVDLPPEHAQDLHAAAAAEQLDLIYLLTPTSDAARIAAVKDVAGGFVYYVSRTGVTGATPPDPAEVAERVATIRRSIDLPICVGFGISGPDQARAMGAGADGVVVGTALVKMVEELADGQGKLAGIQEATRELKDATRPASV